MLLGLRSLVQLTNLTSLYICLLSPSSWMLKGRYTLVETRHRPWRLRSKDLLKQVKTKAEFKGYDPETVCFKSRHILSPCKASFLLFSQAWLLALLFINHQRNLRHHPYPCALTWPLSKIIIRFCNFHLCVFSILDFCPTSC